MYPEGWLIDPNRQWLLLFHKDPIYWEKWPKIYMDKWSTTEFGTPKRLMCRRKIELEPAIEAWNKLIQNGWEGVNGQFGAIA